VNSGILTSPAFTVCAWFKSAAFSSNIQTIFYAESEAVAEDYHRVGLQSGENGSVVFIQTVEDKGNAGFVTAIGPSYVPGQWMHVCAVHASKASRALYTNGVLRAMDTTNIGPGTPNSIRIGARDTGWGTVDGVFNGALDDVRLYDRALTDTEVLGVYSEAGTPAPLPPVISGVSVTNIRDTSASINWTTDKPVHGQIEFDLPCPAGGCLTGVVSALLTAHAMNVTGLRASTTYVYRVRSIDGSNNLAVSSNYSFKTAPAPAIPAPLPPSSSGPGLVPVGHWRFEEGSGTTVVDSSGKGNHGTIVNSPSWTAGRSGSALTFDGVRDYVDLGNPAALNLTGAMSASAWMKTGQLSNGRIISKSGWGKHGWSLNLENYDAFEFSIASDSETQVWVDSKTAVPLNTWVHVTGVYEPGVALRIYVNGVLNNVATTGIPKSQFDAPVPAQIGARGGPCDHCYFDGSLDEIRVYDRVLTPAEVFQIYSEMAPAALTSFSQVVVEDAAQLSETVNTGYGVIEGENSRTHGLAILSRQQNGVLVGETLAEATSLTTGGRVYAEVNERVNTGLTIVNPNDTAATISYFFTGPDGIDYRAGEITIAPNSQLLRLLSEAPFASGTSGTFTFQSSLPVAVSASRTSINEMGDLVIANLPVASQSAALGEVVFPHFVSGSGWSTQILLINPTNEAMTGSLFFYGAGADGAAQAIDVSIDGQFGQSIPFSLPPRGFQRLQTSGEGSAQTGFIRVTPDGPWSPAGVAIMGLRSPAGITLSEDAIASVQSGSRSHLLYTETDGSTIRSAVALTNASPLPIRVDFDLYSLAGEIVANGTLTLPANGYVAKFLQEIPGLESVPSAFQGVLKITDNAMSLAVVGLRLRENERQEILTTMIPVFESDISQGERRFFTMGADGGGYATRFVLFSADGEPVSASLSIYAPSSEVLQ
jgi:hypothetical protein